MPTRAGDSDRTFPDLTTDSNCHRPTTTSLSALSLPTCLFVLCSSTAPPPPPLVYYRFSFCLPPCSPSLFDPWCVFVYPCTRGTFAERHPRVYHHRHTLSLTAPPPSPLFLRSTPSRTRCFVTVSLSSLFPSPSTFALSLSAFNSSSLLRHTFASEIQFRDVGTNVDGGTCIIRDDSPFSAKVYSNTL